MASLEEKLQAHCEDLLESDEKRELTAFCPACNAQVSAYAAECPSCGHDLQADEGTPRGAMVTYQLIGRDGADLLLAIGLVLAILSSVAALISACVLLLRGEWLPAAGCAAGALQSAALAVVFHRTQGL